VAKNRGISTILELVYFWKVKETLIYSYYRNGEYFIGEKCMRNNELKFLANLAKQRLMNKDYSNTPNIRSRASNYFIKNAMALKRLKAETNYVTIESGDDVEFIERVRNLMEEDCYNPLGKLCDNAYFESLDKFGKEFYILNLSEKYNRVRNQLMCG
jgi:hypothetical protein